MARKIFNKEKIKEKLTFKYRLVILNEDTFEERFSFKLNRLNVFVFAGLFSIFLITITSFLIAFTPLKEYIPGYSSSSLKREASDLVYKVDSLEHKLAVNDVYIQNIQQVLTGKIDSIEINKDSIEEQLKIEEVNLNPTAIDSIFREDVESEERYNVFDTNLKKEKLNFSSPISGKITEGYNPTEKHYAIDIAVGKDAPVKVIADGTVIFTGFTSDTGFVIIVEHIKGFLSIYKHNALILKEQGDLVKSGEVIANAGSTGELSTGTHLHFELWSDGYPVNPIDFISFE